MRAYALGLPLAALLCVSTAALAREGIHLPTAPHGSGGEDSIETADGTRCRQSINSNGAYLDFGAAGSAASPLDRSDADQRLYLYQQDRDREALAYMRVTIPLGRRPARIDCSRLYQMELERLQRELEMLRLAAE